MGILQLDDSEKYGKEHLLLGDKKVTIKDCDGNDMDINGLMANDLTIKMPDGQVLPLWEYIQSLGASQMDLSNATVVNKEGNTVNIKDVVDSVIDVKFEIEDLKQKYENQGD